MDKTKGISYLVFFPPLMFMFLTVKLSDKKMKPTNFEKLKLHILQTAIIIRQISSYVICDEKQP